MEDPLIQQLNAVFGEGSITVFAEFISLYDALPEELQRILYRYVDTIETGLRQNEARLLAEVDGHAERAFNAGYEAASKVAHAYNEEFLKIIVAALLSSGWSHALIASFVHESILRAKINAEARIKAEKESE